MTLVTSGLIGHDSSASADLQRFLESRLMTRLDTAGSTLFKLTWKGRTTPLGRRYLERAASVRRTSGSDCTSSVKGWQTPEARNQDGYQVVNGKKWPRLGAEAKMAAWPSPQAHDERKRGNTEADHHHFPHDLSNAVEIATETCNAAGNTDSGRKTVWLASGWNTPTGEDVKTDGPRAMMRWERHLTKGEPLPTSVQRLRNQAQALVGWATPRSEDSECVGAHRGIADGLHSQAKLAAWVSPTACSRGQQDPEIRKAMGHAVNLQDQVRLTASGETPTGFGAATESIGQLNPEHSRWLQALPIAFSSCADTAMQSARKSRKHSSKRV